MNKVPVVVENVYEVAPASLWKALTDEVEMKKWYFDIPGFKAEPGYKFRFYGGSEEKKYLHLCEVTEVVREKKLQYSWKYDGYAGNSLVCFELFREGNQTCLRITHEGLETFPPDNPDLAKKNFEEGWKHIAGISLKDYLEKN